MQELVTDPTFQWNRIYLLPEEGEEAEEEAEILKQMMSRRRINWRLIIMDMIIQFLANYLPAAFLSFNLSLFLSHETLNEPWRLPVDAYEKVGSSSGEKQD